MALLQDPTWDWYNISVVKNKTLVKETWTSLKGADEFRSTPESHHFSTVDLSFSFPFYGRRVRRVVVSSAGGVILSADVGADGHVEHEEPQMVPSHAAPFMSSLPPGDDEVLYYDFGENLCTVHTFFLHMLLYFHPAITR